LVLDALGTDALFFRDPALLVHLDEWSLRAVTLAPNIATVRATRGWALVELGRYAEAKPILEPLTLSAEAPFDRILSHAFLARAEHALGDAAAARHHASEARNATALPRMMTTFVERLAADVGADQQQAEPEPAQLPS
jgi:predicted Zn-dependent protease